MDNPLSAQNIVHAFAGGRLDRRADLRQRNGPRLIIRLAGDRAVVANRSEAAAELVYFQEPSGRPWVRLGVNENGQTLAAEPIEEKDVPSQYSLRDLRSLAMQGLLPAEDLAILAQARSLLVWHERHGFCANCGEPTEMKDGGYRRDCPKCAAQHFPRTDPVVITAVTGPSGVLLGRGHNFQPRVYSTLAGFMEPGESIEEAARREILEETGVTVSNVRYHSSQPWPFPSSLMIGLIATTTGSRIKIDASELADARWFTAGEINTMFEGTHPEGLMVPKAAAIAHHLIRAALQQL
jgi:NAD+ diphosphatase